MKKNKNHIEKQNKDEPLNWKSLAVIGIILLIVCIIIFFVVDKYKLYCKEFFIRDNDVPYQYMFNLCYPHYTSQNILIKSLVLMFLVEIYLIFILKGRVKKTYQFIIQMSVFLVFFISTETILRSNNSRQIVFTRPHPVIIWGNIEGYSNKFSQLHFNNDGFRSEEIPVKKSKNEKRILILGDSCLFGFKLPNDKTVGFQLEDLLNENDNETEWIVLNSAVVGHTTLQGKYILEKRGIKYQPDYILVGYNNDNMHSRISDSQLLESQLITSVKLLLYKSDIFLGLKKMVSIYKINCYLKKHNDKNTHNNDKCRVSQEECRHNIEYFIEQARKTGAVPLIIIMPTNPPSLTDNDECKKTMKKTTLENNAYVLDLNEKFRNKSNLQEYFKPDDSVHFSEKGAKTASKYIFNEIVELEKK